MRDEDRRLNVLLVEDDQIDRICFERAMKRRNFMGELKIASDGIEALEILRGRDGKPDIASPFIMIIDINMPRMNGLELLREIRSDAELSRSVGFVLTTSGADDDINGAYENHAAGYIQKGDSEESFERTMSLIETYREAVCLPTIG